LLVRYADINSRRLRREGGGEGGRDKGREGGRERAVQMDEDKKSSKNALFFF
jgi:hypothetical protein